MTTLKPRAVLFDLDGVLLDSIDAWHGTFNDVLEHYGKKRISKKTFLDDVLGKPIEEDSKHFPGSTPEGIRKLYIRFFPKNACNIKPYEGAIKLLQNLRKKGIKTALVTNTPRKLTESSLKASGLAGMLDVVKTPDDVPAGKPDPAMLLSAMKELCAGIDESIMVGDTIVDVQAARNAGVKVVGIGVQGDMQIKHIREMEKLLGL
ncbi:MAG: HAD family hydrolase [Candidatus Altiarchaeota archaeon]|nr:HAD family hydrolase [Candidatus Altiarchaeota archaeon]